MKFKKLKLLLPALLGGIAIASIAPAVVSCSSDNSEEEKPSNPDQGGTGGGNQNPGGGGSGGGDGTKPNPPIVDVPVEGPNGNSPTSQQVWDTLFPIIKENYKPEDIKKDLTSCFNNMFNNGGDAGLSGGQVDFVSVEKIPGSDNEVNSLGKFDITINCSYKLSSGESFVFNQKVHGARVIPVLVKYINGNPNADWDGITHVMYVVEVLDPLPMADVVDAEKGIGLVDSKPANESFYVEVSDLTSYNADGSEKNVYKNKYVDPNLNVLTKKEASPNRTFEDSQAVQDVYLPQAIEIPAGKPDAAQNYYSGIVMEGNAVPISAKEPVDNSQNYNITKNANVQVIINNKKH